MSGFTKLLLGLCLMSLVGRYCLFTKDPELRTNKKYNIFIICSGFISFIIITLLCYNVIRCIVLIVNFIKGVF